MVLLAVGSLWVIPFDPAAIFLSAPGIVIAGLAACLASRFGTWAKILSLVVGLLLVLMTTTFGQLGLVASVFDFVPAVTGLIGGLLMVVGSVVAMRSRGGTAPGSQGLWRPPFASVISRTPNGS